MLNITVEVKIKHIHCGNTEDIHGADELFITSAFSDGTPEHTQAAIVGKFSINDDQSRNPNETIFKQTLPSDKIIRGGLHAFDEDSKKDWSKKPEWTEKAKDGVVAGLSSSGNPYAVGAGQVLDWGYKIIDKLMLADKDDHLGSLTLDIPVQGPEIESRTWHFWNDGDWLGYSSWNYSVTLEIKRTRERLYTAVWQPNNYNETGVYGWNRRDFLKKYNDLWNDNHRLHALQSYIHNGQELWNAVWKPENVNEIAIFGWKREHFLVKHRELWGQDLRLHILQAYIYNGQELWNAVWRPAEHNLNETAVYGWKRKDFLDKYKELWEHKQRLHILQAYIDINGQELWNAVWRPSESDEVQVYGWKYEHYRKKYDELWGQGWRIHILQPYIWRGQVLYNAVWRPGNFGEIQIYGSCYDDFVKKHKELYGQNMRLHTLLSY